MILGRLITLTDGEAFSPLPARQLTKIFVCGDAISFMVQAAGKVYQALVLNQY
jgi:hypothetical protein